MSARNRKLRPFQLFENIPSCVAVSSLHEEPKEFLYFWRGGDGMSARNEAPGVKRADHTDLIGRYRLPTLPQRLPHQALFLSTLMGVESSKLLTNSDISTIIVPMVSVEKRRHRKGRSLAQDHLCPPWENQDPNPGSRESGSLCHHWWLGRCSGLSASKPENPSLHFRLLLGPPGLLLVLSLSSGFF